MQRHSADHDADEFACVHAHEICQIFFLQLHKLGLPCVERYNASHCTFDLTGLPFPVPFQAERILHEERQFGP